MGEGGRTSPLELENSIKTVQYPDRQSHDLLIEIQKKCVGPPLKISLWDVRVEQRKRKFK